MFVETFPTIRKACEWAEQHQRPVEWCEIRNADGVTVSEHHRGKDDDRWCQITWSYRCGKFVFRRRHVSTSQPYTK